MGCTDGGPEYETSQERNSRLKAQLNCSDAELDLVKIMCQFALDYGPAIKYLRTIIKEQMASEARQILPNA